MIIPAVWHTALRPELARPTLLAGLAQWSRRAPGTMGRGSGSRPRPTRQTTPRNRLRFGTHALRIQHDDSTAKEASKRAAKHLRQKLTSARRPRPEVVQHRHTRSLCPRPHVTKHFHRALLAKTACKDHLPVTPPIISSNLREQTQHNLISTHGWEMIFVAGCSAHQPAVSPKTRTSHLPCGRELWLGLQGENISQCTLQD